MRTLFSRTITPALRIGLEWKVADLWIGVFWTRRGNMLHVWVCLAPCLPIHVEIKQWEYVEI